MDGSTVAARPARIALVGGSIDEVAKVMVEGESGILASARAHERLTWRASAPCGSIAASQRRRVT